MLRKMYTIGVLSGTIESHVVLDNSYAASILQGVVMASERRGYDVAIHTQPWEGRGESLRRYRDRRTDGIVVIAPPLTSDIVPKLTSIGLFMSVVSYPGETCGVPSVDVDNEMGTRLAIDYLISLGHRRIANLSGPDDMMSARIRLDAYLSLMKSAGLDIPPEYIGPGAYSEELSCRQTRRLLDLDSPPTAIIAGNDENAAGALKAARNKGVDVPGRLSIIGFDGLSMGSITTVWQPAREIGSLAAELLFRMLRGEKADLNPHILTPKLIVRETTAPVNGRS